MNERYLEYLASREWKAKRAAVKERCNNICERCHRYLVDEVHHLTYDRVYSEGLEDLQGLCAPCHAFLHGGSGIDPLQRSIHIKVSWKCVEYWDTKIGKFRRVSMDKLRKPNGNHYHELGQFDVPMDVFLDETGHPIFDPARWQKFKTAWDRKGSSLAIKHPASAES